MLITASSLIRMLYCDFCFISDSRELLIRHKIRQNDVLKRFMSSCIDPWLWCCKCHTVWDTRIKNIDHLIHTKSHKTSHFCSDAYCFRWNAWLFSCGSVSVAVLCFNRWILKMKRVWSFCGCWASVKTSCRGRYRIKILHCPHPDSFSSHHIRGEWCKLCHFWQIFSYNKEIFVLNAWQIMPFSRLRQWHILPLKTLE